MGTEKAAPESESEAAVACDADYRGAMRSAPSMRMVSPLR